MNSKFRNVQTCGYDSKKEFKRAQELKLLEAAGQISNLREQVTFVLLSSQRDDTGKLVERPLTYVADFVYIRQGQEVVEDVKSRFTRRNPLYVAKRKLMFWVHQVRIQEV